MTADTHSRTVARNAATVAGATMASRLLGFARDLITAFVLGAGFGADAFFVAWRIPNLLRRLFGEGSLTMAFVPIYSRTKAEQGAGAAHRLTRSTMVWLLAILGGLILLAWAFAPYVVMAIAPGFGDDPALLDFTATLLRICFPFILLISATALCMGALNAEGHFLMPALAPCALNVALILFALAAWATGVNVAVAMSVAVLVGGAAQLAMQQRPLGRTGFAWRGDWALGDPGVKRVGRLMLPTVLGAAVYQINIVLITLLASFLPVGSISYLYYADRLVQLPLGVVAQAVSTAALPNLSALAADRDEAGFAKTLDSALGFSMFLALPATAGLLALSQTIIATLFGHGEFDRTAVLASSEALLAFGVGLPAIAFYRPLVSAFYALENSRTPVRIAILCMVVNVLAGWGLMQGMAHAGLALAVSIAAWLNGALLTVALSRKLGRTPGLTRSVGLSLVLSVALYAGVRLTAGWGWPALVIIPAWAVAYIGAARALGVEEAHMAVGFARRLRDKVRRRG